MPRTKDQIRTELDAAQALDRTLKLQTPEYKANRQRIGNLVRELAAATPLMRAEFTEADYQNWPDSFEQMAVNRERAAKAPSIHPIFEELLRSFTRGLERNGKKEAA
jgi:hypothetical protein